MSTCNWLDLQTLGSQPVIMPKNLPDHCPEFDTAMGIDGEGINNSKTIIAQIPSFILKPKERGRS